MSEDAKTRELNRLTSIDFIRNSGAFAVRALKGNKKPVSDWNPKQNNPTASEEILTKALSPEYEDNIGLHLCGDLVDVDLDTDNPYLTAALDHFLPKCGHVYGRKSRPRTHRIYRVNKQYNPEEYAFLNRLQKHEDTNMEARGGNMSRGEYSLLPGSTHPEGELYEWSDINAARMSITTVQLEVLMRGIRFACAAAVLVPHWVEGVRNEMSMALAGMMYRLNAANEEITHSQQDELDLQGASMFLKGVMVLAGDEKSDQYSRIKSFGATWAKGEKGSKITGATRMAELIGKDGEDTVHRIQSILTDSRFILELEKFCARFLIWQGTSSIVDLDAVVAGLPKYIMNKDAFNNSFSHLQLTTNDGKNIPFVNILTKLKSAIRVTGFEFDPDEEPLIHDDHDRIAVNLWSGYSVDPSEEKVSEEEVRPFIDYVYSVLANNDQKTFDWIMQWTADIFQNPTEKPGTALVLVGDPGAGKSFFGEGIVRPIIGEVHSTQTNTVSSLTKKFNIKYANKLFVQCDEATTSKQVSNASLLKSLITDKTMEVEPKGIDSYSVSNHSRFIFTSNMSKNAVYIGDGLADRRYTVVEVSKMRKNDLKWWTEFRQWVRANLSKIHRYLTEVEIDKKIICRPLHTKARIETIGESLDIFDEWVLHRVAQGTMLNPRFFTHPAYAHNDPKDNILLDGVWHRYISLAPLVQDYTIYSQGKNEKGRMNEQGMANELRKRQIITRVEEERTRKSVTIVDRNDVKRRVYITTYGTNPIWVVKDYYKETLGIEIESNAEDRGEDIPMKERTSIKEEF